MSMRTGVLEGRRRGLAVAVWAVSSALLAGRAEAAQPPREVGSFSVADLAGDELRINNVTLPACGQVEIYDPSHVVSARASETCLAELEPLHAPCPTGSSCTGTIVIRRMKSTACARLFKGTTDEVSWAVSREGQGAYEVIKYRPPVSLGELRVPAADGECAWPDAELPPRVTLPDNVWVFDGQWREVPTKNGKLPDLPLACASLGKKPGVFVSFELDDSSRQKVRVMLEARAKLKEPEPDDSFDLEAVCSGILSSAEGKTDSRFVICFDDTNQLATRFVTYERKSDGEVERIEPRILVNEYVTVFVWGSGVRKVTFSGDATFSDNVYRRANLLTSFDGQSRSKQVLYKQRLGPFGPFKAGAVKLTLADTASDSKIPTFESTIRVVNVYKSAVRLGLGVAYAPSERRLGLRPLPSGDNGVVIVSGKNGVLDQELMFGYSFFCAPVEADVPSFSTGLYLGLGVLSVSGTKALSSLQVGLDLGYGWDWSLTLAAGLRRVELPDAGFEAGKAVPSTTTAVGTHFGVEPTIGLVLNMTPDLLGSSVTSFITGAK